MAFDRTNQAHLTALKTEVDTDPIGMGYAAVVDQTQLLLKKLNDPAENVGGDTAAQELNITTLLDVIDTAEFGGQQVDQGERDWLRMALDAAIQGMVTLEDYRAKIKALFPVNGATNNAIDALTRAISRAEVLWGVGTVITRDDWFAARDKG